MNILLVSQCQKNALTETRRILDQFAERCGDRVWQTPITKVGLETLYTMLRKSARKNTAVACYWTHGKNLTDLLWVVGDKSQFNEAGRVPTNRTTRDILRTEDEGEWSQAYSIKIMTALAALLHDLGKSSIAFQEKLKPNANFYPDCYRHEWISARLFECMIQGCETDQKWLTRLSQWQEYVKENPKWLNKLKRDNKKSERGFFHLPPLARHLIWLITSHHKLPFTQDAWDSKNNRILDEHFDISIDRFYKNYYPEKGWVANDSSHPKPKNFWEFNYLATDSVKWQKAITRWTQKALNHPSLFENAKNNEPFFLLLSRLCLILGDHNYSSSNSEPTLGDKGFINKLVANTDANKKPKQALDEHLLGVCKVATRFANLLPKLPKELPSIQKHRAFTQRTAIARFQWQNKSIDLVKSVQQETEKVGFFGVNMASTGCGKTLANAKIMYGLANPKKGARFTVALGLRVLTLQTGLALKEKLSLTDDMLGILVGGSAVKKLFELQNNEQENHKQQKNSLGSESATPWLDEMDGEIHGASFIDTAINLSELKTLLADDKARKLLFSPIVSCTIDHIVLASEITRGGKHILPILRLLTADLVLDEPDDFGLEDLPALSRLVHLAGLFGSRVLLSSATLTPDFIEGLFKAYQAGRAIYNQQKGLSINTDIICGWFDENKQMLEKCHSNNFSDKHKEFIEKRVRFLSQQPVRRKAQIIELPDLTNNAEKGDKSENLNYPLFAKELLKNSIKLHHYHANEDPISKKNVSFGLIRFSNISPMIYLAKELFLLEKTEEFQDYAIHLCCYHSHQILLLRSKLEEKLDKILNRTSENNVFNHLEVSQKLSNPDIPEKQHLFIVLGSPVTEVGRDHDYDWAIVDPSSMRSIIQLAGRIWRHRPQKVAENPNLYLLPTNWHGLQSSNYMVNKAIFKNPGFENKENQLVTHKLDELISKEERDNIQATSRITKKGELKPENSLSDLEHKVTADLLNNSGINQVNAYWNNELANRMNAHLALLTPFRKGIKGRDLICLPDLQAKNWNFSFKEAINAYENPYDTQNVAVDIRYEKLLLSNLVKPWFKLDLNTLLTELATQLNLDETDLVPVALKYASVSLPEYQNKMYQWNFNEELGFWEK
ncbi:CRISPR-associated Cas3 family helicase [Bisgaardia hudsonensis]|uniref:CRISPR-associated Cas3 family helicase n=1 Tax=Bisgaardia hudsonensis TaxID=109472 RepID=A0A4R2MUD1_9PAST|nr:type I-F CRISPR-associated helicase Cas3f [Bisgaardia hudsonensis]TCP11461.1 CRISPR-associated Cas3 family helicase [Bisgaardia hudsonensis]